MIFVICCYEYKDFKSIQQRLDQEIVSKIVLYNAYEFEFLEFAGESDPEAFNMLVEYANNKNIQLDIIVSGHASNIQNILLNPKYKNINIEFWPDFYIGVTYINFNLQGNIIPENSLTDIKYNFISLNGRIKHHRALLVDLLAKYNLIDKGVISWHNVPYNVDQHAPYYPWKYWTPTVLTLDGPYNIPFVIDSKDTYNQYKMPAQYYESFVQLVCESSVDMFVLSEKTAIPLLYKKPFIVYGCAGFHKILEEMGFHLYTEIFDYSFDQIVDPLERAELVTQNINKVCNMSKNEQLILNKSVQDKMLHNQQKALEYAKNPPRAFLDIVKETDLKKFNVFHSRIFHHLEFINLTK
jgi:hypothetical protein